MKLKLLIATTTVRQRNTMVMPELEFVCLGLGLYIDTCSSHDITHTHVGIHMYIRPLKCPNPTEQTFKMNRIFHRAI